MLKSEGDRLRRVVVCSPGKEYFGVGDLKAHNIAERANPKRAKKQNDLLKSTIKTFGAEIIDVDELKSHPNSVFTRDTSVCTPQGYIQLRMGLESRRGEEEWMAQTLVKLGEPLAGIIQPPALSREETSFWPALWPFLAVPRELTETESIKSLSCCKTWVMK